MAQATLLERPAGPVDPETEPETACPSEPAMTSTAVLFTDIVGSTALQLARGDCGWRDLILAHHALVRASLDRWHGFENDTAGDGFYVTFPEPGDAVRCALEAVDTVRPLGIAIRAGVHVGECTIADRKCSGLTVSIGSRITARAGAGEVLVSKVVRELVPAPDLEFTDAGLHRLKGVPGRWQLFSVRVGR